MRVLVTGGAGFIGRHLVDHLRKQHLAVRVIDDFSASTPQRLSPADNLEIVRGCVTDRGAMRAALDGVDMVYHLASVVGQMAVSARPSWAADVSIASAGHLNALAPDTPLVLFSSSAVYGACTGADVCRETDRVTEDEALGYDGGVRGYAYGKLRAERLAAQRTGPTLVVRPFNVVGPGQTGTYGMVVPRAVASAMRGRPVTIYDDGEQSRSFCDVETFVAVVTRLAASCREEGGHRLFNVGTAREVSINALVDMIDEVLGTASARQYVPYRQVFPGKTDVRRRKPCLDRLEDALGTVEWPRLTETIGKIVDAAAPAVPVAPVRTAAFSALACG